MLVSIIVPVYNVEKYLRECLDSIVNQIYNNIEIILVDDGSTDGSPEICDEYAQRDERIIVIHIPNGGVSNARNLGIDKAKGEYIMFVDSDDIIMPYIVERGITLAVENNADIVYGLVQAFKTALKKPKEMKAKTIVLVGDDTRKLVTHMFDLHDSTFKTEYGYVNRGPCARLVSSEIIQGIRFNGELALGEDSIWNLDLLNKYPKCVVDYNLWYGYRMIAGSASHKYRESAKRDFSALMLNYVRFTKQFHAQQHCFNKAWESIDEICTKYYLNSQYGHSFVYANYDLYKSLQEYPWNKIFCFSWACKAGVKGIIKWILIKLNLVLVFKLVKNKLKGDN